MVDQILSHATYIAIGIIAVLMIISAVYGMKGNIQDVDAKAKMDYITDNIENNILEMKTIGGSDFETKIKIDASDNYKVTLTDNLITINFKDIEVTKQINMQMSGSAYLPAYLVYKANEVTIQ